MGPTNRGRNACLGPAQVAKMRRLYTEHGMSTNDLARRFGVGHTTAYKVVMGKGAYGDVEDEGTPSVDDGGDSVHPSISNIHRRTDSP